MRGVVDVEQKQDFGFPESRQMVCIRTFLNTSVRGVVDVEQMEDLAFGTHSRYRRRSKRLSFLAEQIVLGRSKSGMCDFAAAAAEDTEFMQMSALGTW